MAPRFTKFHGYGNDYLVFESDQLVAAGDLGSFAKRVCNRHYGAGADGIAIVQKSEPPADRGPQAGSQLGVVVAGGTGKNSEDDAIQTLLLRHLRPRPRVGWGIVLGEERLASAMIDISDGLSSDLKHLCGESNTGALIQSDSLPLDENVVRLCGRRALDPLALALHGGEDFELLFTVSPDNAARLPKRVDGVAISWIGKITNEPGEIRIAEKNRVWDLEALGFEHFGDRDD